MADNIVEYQVAVTKTGSGAADAANELKSLQAAAQASGASLASTRTVGAETSKGFEELAGKAFYVRSGMDAIRAAAMDGGARAGFYAVDEAIRGMVASGLKMGTILPILGGLAAAAGAGYLVWRTYADSLEWSDKKAKEFAEDMKQLSELLQEVQTLQNTGLLGTGAASEYRDYLGPNPRKQLYVDENGQVTTSATHIQHRETDPYQLAKLGIDTGGDFTVSNRKASQTEAQKWVQDQITANGHLSAEQISAAEKLKELHAQDLTDSLNGIQKEISAENDRFQKELQHLQQLKGVAGNTVSDKDYAGDVQAATDRHNAALQTINEKQAAEQQRILDEENRAQDEALRYQQEQYDKLQREKKAALDEAGRQEKQLGDLENKIKLDNLTGEERKQEAIRQTTQAFIKQYTELATALGISQAAQQKEIALIQSGAQVQAQATQENKQGLTDIQQVEDKLAHQFASGLTSAIMEFAEGTKSASQAFSEFAASFMMDIAKMIDEALVLTVIEEALGMTDGKSFNQLFIGNMKAEGGVEFAANGLAGVASVSSPTYFPKFNTVAGEAGMEMLTVLARPTFRSLGGIDAIVGNAGSSRLAISNADALANRGGAGGHIVIEMRGTPDFEARVISSSVKGAQVQIANDLKRHTPISQGVKSLTA